MSATGASRLAAPAPAVHLCLVEPEGFAHSGALLDPLKFFGDQFQKLGAEVTVGRNSVEPGAVNFVFGAHLGFPEALARAVTCVFVNLEQLGSGGARVPEAYADLLRRHPCVDYHRDNTLAYRADGAGVTLARFGFASYLRGSEDDLMKRPIDLLFLGSLTERRITVLRRLEGLGVNVRVPASPVYGPRRDELVRSAKAVLNVSAYDSARFEQVRASVVLSCGTPIVTENRTWTHADDAWLQPFVHHFDADRPERFFGGSFLDDSFCSTSRAQLDAWTQVDVSDDYRRLLEVAATLKGSCVSAPGRVSAGRMSA